MQEGLGGPPPNTHTHCWLFPSRFRERGVLAFTSVPTVDSNQAPMHSPNPMVTQEALVKLKDHSTKSKVTNLGK